MYGASSAFQVSRSTETRSLANTRFHRWKFLEKKRLVAVEGEEILYYTQPISCSEHCSTLEFVSTLCFIFEQQG